MSQAFVASTIHSASAACRGVRKPFQIATVDGIVCEPDENLEHELLVNLCGRAGQVVSLNLTPAAARTLAADLIGLANQADPPAAPAETIGAGLAAAAPELLAACEAFVDYYEQAGIDIDDEDDDVFDGDERFNVRLGLAAIAKARL